MYWLEPPVHEHPTGASVDWEGAGVHDEEAMDDAAFILAFGLHWELPADDPLPEPITIEEAKALAQGILEELHLTADDVDWLGDSGGEARSRAGRGLD